MGLRTRFPPGYHFHRPYNWQDFSEQGHEVSFELADDEASA
jgi:hypothetical protein